MFKEYKRKPSGVKAFQWGGIAAAGPSVAQNTNGCVLLSRDNLYLDVHTEDGNIQVCVPGDWVLHAGGEDYYVCKDEKFKELYETGDQASDE